MSPLFFLLIPVVVFVVGSTLLYLRARFLPEQILVRRAPEDLAKLAPSLSQSREVGFGPKERSEIGSRGYPGS